MADIQAAIKAIDEINKQDPNKITINGSEYPAEFLHSLRLTEAILELNPSASAELLVAARCQHIARWTVPRTSYPEGKAAYLTWRKDLAKMHAATAGEILNRLAFNEDFIKRVQEINLKQNLKLDPEVQTMEDALCLVFLRYQLDAFMQTQEEDKMVTIIQKSWRKMSEAGRKLALEIKFSPESYSLVARAIG